MQSPSTPGDVKAGKICRCVAPPLPSCADGAVEAALELVAAHLRQAVPSLADLTVDEIEIVLADLRAPLRELMDAEVRDALLFEQLHREADEED
jgi:hypothetical protein